MVNEEQDSTRKRTSGLWSKQGALIAQNLCLESLGNSNLLQYNHLDLTLCQMMTSIGAADDAPDINAFGLDDMGLPAGAVVVVARQLQNFRTVIEQPTV